MNDKKPKKLLVLPFKIFKFVFRIELHLSFCYWQTKSINDSYFRRIIFSLTTTTSDDKIKLFTFVFFNLLIFFGWTKLDK